MGTYVLGMGFRTYSVTASSSAPERPASNLTKMRRPFLPWAASGGVDGVESVVVDFGTAVQVPGAFFNAANFASCAITAGADGSTWPDTLATASIARDPDLGRRKFFQPLTMATPRRYMRFVPSGWDGLDAINFPDITGFALGVLAFPTPLEDMVQNWGENGRDTPVEPGTGLGWIGGGQQINREGRRYKSFELPGGPWRTATLEQMRRLENLGKGTPFFMWLRRDAPLTDNTQAWILQRTADVSRTPRFRNYDATWLIEEFV